MLLRLLTLSLAGILLALPAVAAEEANPMETYQDQLAFFKEHWPAMKAAAEKDGADGVIKLIAGYEDDLQRRVLYMFSRQGLMMGDWEGKSLDACIAVADAGIAEFLAQSEAAADDETRDRRIDGANVLSYNLSADLAACWPGDETPRETRHFERGYKAAVDCIGWRGLLNKPPGPFSMAYWAKGMHEISLGKYQESVASFTKSLAFAKQDATAGELPATVSAEGTYSVVVGAGYLGLARLLAGDEAGQVQYDEAIAAFTAQLEIEDKKDDAQFGIDQLEVVKAKYLK